MTIPETKNFLGLVRQRYSLRDFAPVPVEQETLEYILETARLAPSAVNFQPWVFIVIRDTARLQALKTCYRRDWIETAPACIVVCADHAVSWKRRDGKDHADIDAAIAAEHIALAATEQGLGTCWVCNFDTTICREVLHLPESVEPVVLLPIDYPSDQAIEPEKKRKPLNEIVRWEEF